MLIVLAPISRACLSAARLSAVSPLWLIIITRQFSSITGSAYLNSPAYSANAGIFATFSKLYFAISPTW